MVSSVQNLPSINSSIKTTLPALQKCQLLGVISGTGVCIIIILIFDICIFIKVTSEFCDFRIHVNYMCIFDIFVKSCKYFWKIRTGERRCTILRGTILPSKIVHCRGCKIWQIVISSAFSKMTVISGRYIYIFFNS